MRFGLKGRGAAVPQFALSDPVEGGLSQSFYMADGDTFDPAPYLVEGYTNIQIWCVGAAGGSGGDQVTELQQGGAGGGGGLHRVTMLLADILEPAEIVVGEAGANGANASNHAPDNPSYVPPADGVDGGASSFGDDLCRASGGKGGGASPAPDGVGLNGTPGGDGGDGGVGDSITAGGGAAGGLWTPPTDPVDGAWDGAIGEGGGGGQGGSFDGNEFNYLHNQAANGARGSFSAGEPSVYGPGELRSSYPSIYHGPKAIYPGGGGGAKIRTTGLYGSHASGYSPNGAVFIRLT